MRGAEVGRQHIQDTGSDAWSLELLQRLLKSWGWGRAQTRGIYGGFYQQSSNAFGEADAGMSHFGNRSYDGVEEGGGWLRGSRRL